MLHLWPQGNLGRAKECKHSRLKTQFFRACGAEIQPGTLLPRSFEPVPGHSAHKKTTGDPRSFSIVPGVSLDLCTRRHRICSKSAPQNGPLVCSSIFCTFSHAVWPSHSSRCFGYYRVAVFTRPRQYIANYACMAGEGKERLRASDGPGSHCGSFR